VKRLPIDLLSTLLADVDALEGASCAAAGFEFVDVGPLEADALIRDWCRTCSVIAACRAVGDHLAPHDVASVYGGRFYAEREPADGWHADGAA
jgi:hypothetical protein